MPHFTVILEGRGIAFAVDDEAEPATGFFTTRRVRAGDLDEAVFLARQQVTGEWLRDGAYAAGNRGAVPTLAVEDAFRIGWLAALFGRRPAGYAFYLRDEPMGSGS